MFTRLKMSRLLLDCLVEYNGSVKNKSGKPKSA